MIDRPFWEAADAAFRAIETTAGAHVHQSWGCSFCGWQNTMVKPDTFYRQGMCEECGAITNIEAKGCSFLLATPAVNDSDVPRHGEER